MPISLARHRRDNFWAYVLPCGSSVLATCLIPELRGWLAGSGHSRSAAARAPACTIPPSEALSFAVTLQCVAFPSRFLHCLRFHKDWRHALQCHRSMPSGLPPLRPSARPSPRGSHAFRCAGGTAGSALRCTACGRISTRAAGRPSAATNALTPRSWQRCAPPWTGSGRPTTGLPRPFGCARSCIIAKPPMSKSAWGSAGTAVPQRGKQCLLSQAAETAAQPARCALMPPLARSAGPLGGAAVSQAVLSSRPTWRRPALEDPPGYCGCPPPPPPPADAAQAHEWEKHGTCAEDLFPREVAFFNATMRLHAANPLEVQTRGLARMRNVAEVQSSRVATSRAPEYLRQCAVDQCRGSVREAPCAFCFFPSEARTLYWAAMIIMALPGARLVAPTAAHACVEQYMVLPPRRRGRC